MLLLKVRLWPLGAGHARLVLDLLVKTQLVELAVRRLIAPELTHAVGQLRRGGKHHQHGHHHER